MVINRRDGKESQANLKYNKRPISEKENIPWHTANNLESIDSVLFVTILKELFINLTNGGC